MSDRNEVGLTRFLGSKTVPELLSLIRAAIKEGGDSLAAIEALEAEVKRLTEERDPHEHCRGTAACAQGDDLCVAFPASVYAEFDKLRTALAAKDDEIAEVLPMINGVLNTAIAMKAPAADCELLRRWRDAARTALGATQKEETK